MHLNVHISRHKPAICTSLGQTTHQSNMVWEKYITFFYEQNANTTQNQYLYPRKQQTGLFCAVRALRTGLPEGPGRSPPPPQKGRQTSDKPAGAQHLRCFVPFLPLLSSASWDCERKPAAAGGAGGCPKGQHVRQRPARRMSQ